MEHDENRVPKPNAIWLIACMVGMLLWFSLQWTPDYSFSKALSFGDAFWPERVSAMPDSGIFVKEDSNGYDGQFYAQIALDPLMRSEDFESAIDIPSYRGRRILLPTMGYLMGLGQAEWILMLYPFINLIFWFGLLLVLSKTIPSDSWQGKARWIGILFAMGTLESIKFSLTDLPATVLIFTGALLFSRSSRVSGTFSLALAILSKETSALALVLIPKSANDLKNRLVTHATIAGITLIPLCLWTLYLSFRFEPVSGFSQNFAWPFYQWFEVVKDFFTEWGEPEWLERDFLGTIALIGLIFQFTYLILCRDIENRIWRIGLVFGILLTVLGPAVWHGYWAVCRSVLPLTFAFNLLYQPKRFFWIGWLIANASILHGLIRISF